MLAFWLGSVTTDEYGKGSIEVKLPESLTTYRIMAVAADRASRFGSSDAEVRINKPLTLKATFPRFLALGDKAHFGAVVTSQLKTAGAATVTIASLDPDILEFTAGAEQTLQVAAGGSIEARFDAAGKRVGRARVRMTVKIGDETDAFEDVIPVELLVSPETVAAYGEATDANATATETLMIPASVVPGLGGLHVELSSTAMVGLGEGARYLVEYPYGCAEQRGSRTLALVLAADLGDAFSLPGMDTTKMRPSAQQNLKDLEKFQCADGGFSYWVGDCRFTSPYLTAYLLHVFKTAVDQKYKVDAGMRERAYGYLERALAAEPPTNEGWWPSYTAWQAFAVKVLVEGGRNQDSNLTRLYGYRERMPVFALAYLHDALVARGGSSPDSASRARRSPAPHGQRDSARGGQRARRRTERPLSALVLELQRADDVDRAQLARQGQRQRRARAADGAVDDGGAQGRAMGQHAGERAGHGSACRLLPEVRERAAGLPRGGKARHRRLRPRGVQGPHDDVEDEGNADEQSARRRARPVRHAR